MPRNFKLVWFVQLQSYPYCFWGEISDFLLKLEGQPIIILFLCVSKVQHEEDVGVQYLSAHHAIHLFVHVNTSY